MKRTLLLFALLFAVTIGATKADSRTVNAASSTNNHNISYNANLAGLTANASYLSLAPVEDQLYVYAFVTTCGSVVMTTNTELTDRQNDILWVTFEVSCWV